MTAPFLHGLESFFGWLLQASWQASVLAILVLLVQAVARGRLNPRWHHALWFLVVLRLVLPLLPHSSLSLFQFAPQPSPVVMQTVTEPIFVSLPNLPVVANQSPATLPSPKSYPFSAFTLFALAWLAGALALLALTLRVSHRFARHVATASPITDPNLLELAKSAQRELGLHRRLRIIESPQVQSPAIMGLFRPVLILPVEVHSRFTAEELRFIFLHEFAHVKRGDLVVQWLIGLLQILHWFNPILWYAFRRMRIDREPATDALVLSHAGEAQKESYGQVLIKLLEHYHARHALPTLVGLLEDKVHFERRFQLITRFTRGAYGWSMLGAGLIAILAIFCLTGRPVVKSAVSSIGAPVSSANPPLPPIYVRFDKISGRFFGPLTSFQTDNSHFPRTNLLLAGFLQSATTTEATLRFSRLCPEGLQPMKDGKPFQPDPASQNDWVTVPLKQAYSFKIFDSIDVTTSPTLGPTTDPLLYPKTGIEDFQTPLVMAIYGRDEARARVLVEKGEPVTFLAMESALEMGSPSLTRLLWEHGPHFCSEMTYAISQGATVADLEALHARGVPVERDYENTITPLGMAARMGNVPVAQWLLDHGAYLTPQSGRDPLYIAFWGDSAEMVDFLIRKGVRVDTSRLQVAIGLPDYSVTGREEKRLAMLRVMVRAGALDHATDTEKAGLLEVACETKTPLLAKYLMSLGISPASKLADGESVLESLKKAYAQRDVDPARAGLALLIELLEKKTD